MTCRYCRDRPGGCLQCLNSVRRVTERLQRQQAEAFILERLRLETTHGDVIRMPRTPEELVDLVAAAMAAGSEYHGRRAAAPEENAWRRFEMLEMNEC